MATSLNLETRICGIPCAVAVFDIVSVKGSFSYAAPSDLDYYGYTDFDYRVCDQRGRPAPWLERKMTKNDRELLEERINEEIAS